jgi:AraC-like DNA-binding protein
MACLRRKYFAFRASRPLPNQGLCGKDRGKRVWFLLGAAGRFAPHLGPGKSVGEYRGLARIVPMIRAASISAFLGWLDANNRPTDQICREAGLGYLARIGPEQPIPVESAARLVRLIGEREGPDIGCRVVDDTAFFQLAMLAKVALGARTPVEALRRIEVAIARHCTHEVITLRESSDMLEIRDYWTSPFDRPVLHIVQQYVAMLVLSLMRMAEGPKVMPLRVEIIPDETLSLAHLMPWFGPGLVPSKSGLLIMQFASEVGTRPFQKVMRDRSQRVQNTEFDPLRGDGTLSHGVRTTIGLMMEDGGPSIEQVAEAARMSVRTMQRHLADEGTSFSALVDDVRRTQALRELNEGEGSIGALAVALGYSQQSALTRAMRRWTGRPPSHARRRT